VMSQVHWRIEVYLYEVLLLELILPGWCSFTEFVWTFLNSSHHLYIFFGDEQVSPYCAHISW
jgi:hypothetical protein